MSIDPYLIAAISTYSALIPIFISFQKRNQSREVLLLFILFLSSFSIDVTSRILANFSTNNQILSQVYGLVEIIILFAVFSLIFDRKQIIGIAGSIVVLVYSLLTVYEGFSSFNALAKSVESLVFILLALIGFYKIYADERSLHLDTDLPFWIMTSVLMYFSIAFFSFLLATDMLSQAPNRFYSSWILHNTGNTFKNILFAFGIWISKLT